MGVAGLSVHTADGGGTSEIFRVRNGVQVIWVYTRPIEAHVINLSAIGDRANEVHVGHAMSQHLLVVHTNSRIAIA